MTHALRNIALAALLALAAAGAGASGSHADDHHADDASGQAAAPTELSDGEIRKVDPDSAKLTIKHGPLKGLDMPGMTMVFQVKDGAMLDRLQVGDKVRFRAERISGRLTVTEIESVH
ncbi:copper-binding protein [Variovorax sp. J22P271]|uniref:copper-binding protein n=1 Tax=Variovorax davisae TaxID=3053515 RepID=UPI002576F979|nr:copper-binding protein [Variovorax sp. J22P271]MDM0035560.1 copper-binding protein [Variovorax sp. J22P271]